MMENSAHPADEFRLASTSPLKVSRYEQVASWLISFLVIVGTLNGVFLLIWWSKSNRYQPPMYDVSLEEEGYGRGDRPAGFGRDDKAPGDPDLPQMDEPAGSELFEETEPAPAMAFVEDAAAISIAEVGDVAVSSIGTAPRTPGFGGTGGGEGGLGDNRPPGPLGDGVFVIPRWERWEMQYTSASVNLYGQQLDSFGIELGALGGKRDIDYAYNLAKRIPDRRSGPSKTEKRLYMTWKKGQLQQFDREILGRAGIQTAGRIVVQFYPKATEDMLAALERQNARGRSPREFHKTVFGVRPRGSAFEYYVIEQSFRSMPK